MPPPYSSAYRSAHAATSSSASWYACSAIQASGSPLATARSRHAFILLMCSSEGPHVSAVVEVGLGVRVEAVGSASALITLGSMVVSGTNRMVVNDMVAAGPDPDAGAE